MEQDKFGDTVRLSAEEKQLIYPLLDSAKYAHYETADSSSPFPISNLVGVAKKMQTAMENGTLSEDNREEAISFISEALEAVKSALTKRLQRAKKEEEDISEAEVAEWLGFIGETSQFLDERLATT